MHDVIMATEILYNIVSFYLNKLNTLATHIIIYANNTYSITHQLQIATEN